MINSNEIIKQLPEMLSGQELTSKMNMLPEYDKNIQEHGSIAERLIKLSEELTNTFGAPGYQTYIIFIFLRKCL